MEDLLLSIGYGGLMSFGLIFGVFLILASVAGPIVAIVRGELAPTMIIGAVILIPLGLVFAGGTLACAQEEGPATMASLLTIAILFYACITVTAVRLVRKKKAGKEDADEGDAGKKARPAIERRKIDLVIPLLMDLLLIVGYAAAIAGRPLSFMPSEWLCIVTLAQFLAIHSFFFLLLIAMPNPKYWEWRTFQFIVFASILSFYMAVALSQGVDCMTAFLSGALATYGGMLLRGTGGNAVNLAVKRWAASLALFVVMALATGGNMPGREGTRTLYFGLFYFLGLMGLEWSGVYEIQWKEKFRAWKRSWKKGDASPE